jgi:ABC-type amino acid transport substrate-binding protein
MYRRMVRQTLRLGLFVILVVLAMVACGEGGGRAGGGAEAQKEQAKARKVPDYGDLRPGKYVTDTFEPAFSFRVVGEGWVVGGSEERGVLDMRQGVEGPVLSFVNEQKVFDPNKPRDLIDVSAPEDMVAWLQRHPYLQTEEPEPAAIGGLKGVQFDAVVANVPASECGNNCLGLFMIGLEIPWVVYEKEKVHFIVLEDVRGERVTIAAEARADDFEQFLPKAQKVLDTVEWKGK